MFIEQLIEERMNGPRRETVSVDDCVVAFDLNQTYRPAMSAHDLYNRTRCCWKLNKGHAERARYAFAVHRDEIKEVYEIHRWQASREPGRYEFEGAMPRHEIRQKYRHRVMPEEYRHGQNPVRYINC